MRRCAPPRSISPGSPFHDTCLDNQTTGRRQDQKPSRTPSRTRRSTRFCLLSFLVPLSYRSPCEYIIPFFVAPLATCTPRSSAHCRHGFPRFWPWRIFPTRLDPVFPLALSDDEERCQRSSVLLPQNIQIIPNPLTQVQLRQRHAKLYFGKNCPPAYARRGNL